MTEDTTIVNEGISEDGVITKLHDPEVNLNDKRNMEIEGQAAKLHNLSCFMAGINTIVHYADNCTTPDESFIAKLVPTHLKAASGITHYIYRHKGTIGAMVYVNNYFSGHIYHGDKPIGDKYAHCLDANVSDENQFFNGEQLDHFIDFHLDDDESKLTHVYLAPGLHSRIAKEIKQSTNNEEAADAADSYIFDGLLASIEAVIALISDKEIETTFNQAKRIKRIDPYMTLRFDEAGDVVYEKMKVALEAFAVPEENQRYVINVSMFSLAELLMFNRLTLEEKNIDDPAAEGFLRRYDAEMIKSLAEGTPNGYVMAVLETSNGNFNVSYDKNVYVGYSYKQSFNSAQSYVVAMNKQDPSLGFEFIAVVYKDFGIDFTQPLSKENAEIVFKQMVALRPNLHEDYVDSRAVKDVSPSKELDNVESIGNSNTSE